jgi:predicted nucleic acid-binding protein
VNGTDYLLDTNFILGLLKSSQEALSLINDRQIGTEQCAYSSITRMELLGFPGITRAEELLIQGKLEPLTYLPITSAVENTAIRLRRIHNGLKLPDAIIVASADSRRGVADV